MTENPWLESKLTLLAFWDVRAEQPSSLAKRVQATLMGFDAAMGDEGPWLANTTVEVLPRAQELEPVIAAGKYVDDLGDVHSDRAHEVMLQRRGPSMTLVLHVRAGSSVPARRRPSNEVMVDIFLGESSGPSAEQVDRVMLAVAEAWEPASIAVRDGEVTAADSGRGRWDPLIGRRSWVSHDLGIIGETAEGVRAELTVGGTLLAVDDSLSAEQAVAAVRATFERNGVGEIPHAIPAPQAPRPLPSS